jgi:hypothetical protein
LTYVFARRPLLRNCPLSLSGLPTPLIAPRKAASIWAAASVLRGRSGICAVFKGVVGTRVAAARIGSGEGVAPSAACGEQRCQAEGNQR